MQETEERRKAAATSGADDELSFDPVTITFIDLKYFVPNPNQRGGEPPELQLLQGITGTIRPGTCKVFLAPCCRSAALYVCTHLNLGRRHHVHHSPRHVQIFVAPSCRPRATALCVDVYTSQPYLQGALSLSCFKASLSPFTQARTRCFVRHAHIVPHHYPAIVPNPRIFGTVPNPRSMVWVRFCMV